MNEPTAISLLVLRCSDLERSRAFYRVLGVHFAREQHASGPVHYSTKVGETIVELYPKGAKDTSDLRFGIRIGDISGILDLVSTLGGKVVSRPSADPMTAVICDPDGHTIELTLS